MVQGVLRFGLGRLGWFASGGACVCCGWVGFMELGGLGGREVFDQTSMRHSVPVPLH